MQPPDLPLPPPPIEPPMPPPGPIELVAHIVHVVFLVIFLLAACVLLQQLLGATPNSIVAKAAPKPASRTATGNPNHIVAVGMGRRLVNGSGRGGSNTVVPASDAPCWREAEVAASAARLLIEAETAAAAVAAGPRATGASGEAASGAAHGTAAPVGGAASLPRCASVAEEADGAVPASDGHGGNTNEQEGEAQAGIRGAVALQSDGHGQPQSEPAAQQPAKPMKATIVRPRLPPLPSEQQSSHHDLD